MALPNGNIIVSKFAVKERWLKLYRTVFNQFLRLDIVHKQDYLQDIAELNARIAELETKLTAELAKVSAHEHAYASPGGPAITAPSPTKYIAGFSPTKPLVHKETFLEQRNAALQATGPAQAPLGDGSSPQAQLANIKAKEDIGV